MSSGKDHDMRKITVAAVGAGNRMNAYTEYARLHPEQMQVVAVVDPNPLRREFYATLFAIPVENCFATWQDFLQHDRMADAVLLCTPDNMHYEPAMRALEQGYHLLLEKPIAQSWQQCCDIAEKAREKARIVGVCHVLRYHPYFIKFREVVRSGILGQMISVNHIEAVGVERMTHAFVRGLWRRQEDTNPMILSKACHDFDLLVWIIGKHCKEVSSYGSLKWFKESNAPAGSTSRCTDGCLVESECPYSALNLYFRQKRWLRHFDIPEGADAGGVIMNELKNGPYGRCVYRCDNDVVDHQVVSLLMDDDITVSFSMDAFTKVPCRKTHIMCSGGEVWGDELTLTVRYFHSNKPDEIYDFSDIAGECSFHGGADLNIVADFIKAVRKGDASGLSSSIEFALESHRIAFEVEEKRKQAGQG